MKAILRFSFLILVVMTISCQKDGTVDPIDLGLEYFPTEVGNWVIYDVSEIIKDDFTGKTDTFYYQIREIIDSTFLDNEGRPTQRLERFIRLQSSDPWMIHKVWTANRNSMRAEKVEDNRRYVKLSFPTQLNRTWDGNAMNTLDDQQYEYIYTDVPDSHGALSFNSTLTVKQKDDDFINKRELDIEQYAKGVGLIYRQILDLDICFRCSPTFEDTLDAAYIYTETIIDYGSN